jgi:glutathione S-transferase
MAVVPTLINQDGAVIIESNLILEYLDDAYPEPPLKSADPVERVSMRLLTKQLDEGVHAVTGTVSSAVAFRFQWLEGRGQSEIDDLLARMPDVARRERTVEIFEKGLESVHFPPAVLRFEKLFAEMEQRLERTAWLAGDAYSLADIAYTPYLTRFEHLQFLGVLDKRPRLAAWYERVKQRPSYEAAISQWLNEKYLPLMKEKGCEAWPRVQAIIAAG